MMWYRVYYWNYTHKRGWVESIISPAPLDIIMNYWHDVSPKRLMLKEYK